MLKHIGLNSYQGGRIPLVAETHPFEVCVRVCVCVGGGVTDKHSESLCRPILHGGGGQAWK